MKTPKSPVSKLEGNSTARRLPVARPTRLLAGVAFVALVLLASAPVSRAANGVWTNDANSVWSATTNWLNGTVADGTDAIADFSGVDLTTNRTVGVDASHNVGTMIFGDTGGTRQDNWTLTNSVGSVLTMAVSSGAPAIAVSNDAVNLNTTVLAVPLAGTAGFNKVGGGVLTLAAANQYSGATTVSGGTLRLTNNVAGLSLSDPLLYMSFNNVAGPTVFNQGTGGHAMDGTLSGTATIVPDATYGHALAIPGGTSSAAYVLVNNPVVLFSISSPAAWSVAFWFQTSTAGATFLYQGAGGWANANTTFFLNQGGGATGGNQAGGVSYARGWEKGTAVVNDGNWHHFVMTVTNGVKTLYMDGAVDALTTDQWGGVGIGTQVRIGGNGTGEGDGNVGLAGKMAQVYIYGRALSAAEVSALYASPSTGPTSLASALPNNSPVSVASGATMDLNNSIPQISAVSGSGLVDNLAAGTANLLMNVTNDAALSVTLTNSGGAVTLTKLGNAALTISGVQAYRGATVVNGGTVNITGSLKPSDGGGSGSGMTVNSGVVNFSGTLITNYTYNIGLGTNFTGAFYQDAGILTQTRGGNGTDFQLGSGAFGYGYYYLAAGATNNCNEIGLGGEGNPSGSGQMDVYGTINDSGWLTVTRGTTGNTAGINDTGILNVWPGSTVLYAGGGLVCNWSSSGGTQTAVINGLGGNVYNQPGNFTINLNSGNQAVNTGILNLDGGIIQASSISGGATGTSRVNFQGGTLMASGNNGGYVNNAHATVYVAGGTINNVSNNITLAQQLSAPTGKGEQSISSFTGGTNYMAPPIVQVVSSDGNGVGATAIAQINPVTGVVTNVMITSPGDNYTATPNFVLTGGNPTTPATITGAAPTANAQGGSMTFLGSGQTTLNGGYNYTGPTFVYGGTLGVVVSNVTPSVAGSVTVSNGGLSAAVATGYTWPMGNLTLTVSNGMTINYGSVPANPTVPAITVNGSPAVAPTNLINVSGLGFFPGQFPLIKYTSGTVSASDFANIGLIPPQGAFATLVNNTPNNSVDINISFAPLQVTWNGLNGSIWDVGTTANWTNSSSGITVFQQFDGVTLDDTLTNNPNVGTPTGPAPTNINLTVLATPYPLAVNSTLNYSIAGAGGIGGNGSFVKNNTGSLTLLTSNNFFGGFTINGGTVVITNDFSLGTNNGAVTLNGGSLQVNGNTTNNARVLNLTAATTIGVATNVTAQFGSLGSGGSSLTKTDNGTLVLGGNNVLSALNATQGTLILTASNRIPVGATVGGGANGRLILSGGALNSTGGDPSIIAGNASGAAGHFIMNSGRLVTSSELYFGTVGGGYGAITINGGTATVGAWFCLSRGGGIGILNMNGGNVNITANNLTIGTIAGTGNSAEADIAGGNFVVTNGGIYVGEITPGVLNISGSANVTAMGTLGVSFGNNNAAQSGVLNLNGGTLSTPVVARRGGLFAKMNFNGGTLKASASSASFMSGLDIANVYSNGFTIDDGGNGITIPQNLIGQTNGYGLASIPIFDGGANYIGPPLVTILDTGASGTNASAIAQIDPVKGTVTNVVITCPGYNYDPANSYLQINFSGGGAAASLSAASVDPTAITYIQNNGGGVTKQGSGTVTLSGANNLGPVTNNAGALVLSSASTYGAMAVNAGSATMSTAVTLTGDVTVSNGASFSVVQSGTNTSTLNNVTLDGGTSTPGAVLAFGVTGLNPNNPLARCGTLTLNGTNSISLAGAINVGNIPLLKYTGAIGGSGNITNLSLPQGASGYVSNYVAGSTLFAIITDTGPGLVWSGTNTMTVASTNLWDIGTTTNWWLNGTATSYHQPLIPGDVVTFNDTGSGTVVINTNVGPTSLVISNSTKNYTFKGTGNISGPGNITKLGTATAILNLTNDSYTGNLVISNGAVQLGSATAFSSGTANLNIGPSGFLQLSGYAITPSSLTGSGTIDNAGTTIVPLTIGNGVSSWSGNITSSGSGSGGAISLAVNGTLTLSGNANLNNLAVGNANGSLAAVYQIGGGITNLQGSGGDLFQVGNVAGAFGYYALQGGTMTVNGMAVGGENYQPSGFSGTGGNGILDIYPGTFLNNVGWLVMSRGGTAETGLVNVYGGSMSYAGGGIALNWGANQTATVNVMGGIVTNSSGVGINLNLGGQTSITGFLNLDGGLVQANNVNGGSGGGTFVNFNGGTLRASANNGNFISGTPAINIFAGGATIDDGGHLIHISQPLLATTGYGVSSIALTSHGSGYTIPPTVAISGGNGSGASASAQINPANGTVTGLVITCPGSGYNNTDTLTVTFTAAGGNPTPPVTGAIAFVQEGTGGLTKQGSGTLYLDAANTYTASTVVANGTLAGVGSVAGSVTVQPAGILGAGNTNTPVGTFTIGGNLAVNGSASLRISKTGGVKTNDQVAVTGTITYGGTLIIQNVTSDGTSLVINDQFQVFNKGGSANFTSVVGYNGGTFTFDNTTGLVTVTGVGAGTFTQATRITQFSLSGANVLISGSNGQLGCAYYLMESTNVAAQLNQWTPVWTNVLGANGNYSFTATNVVSAGGAQQFYILSNTNH